MRIGLATPISIRLMQGLVVDGESLPAGYEFAPAADWLKELLHQGHEVTVYTTARDVEREVTFSGARLLVRIAPARPSGAGRDLFRAERHALTRMMTADGCDCIHAHWTYEFALAALASGRPTLITVHDLPWNVLRYFRDGHRLAKVLMAYRAAVQGRHFTAVSEDAARHFRRYFAPWAQVHVVPNGLPDAVFELGSPARSPSRGTCVFATNLQGWSARKNASLALRAFRIVRQERPGCSLLMFGTGYEAGGMAEQWAQAHKLAEGVEFAGRLSYDHLLRRMASDVDVLVHPSLDESFSMASLEAMALRKPVIAGQQTPGVREVLGYGAAGLLVDMTSSSALAAAMLRLAIDPRHRSAVAAAGYARAWQAYRLPSVMRAYETLYAMLQKEDGRGGIQSVPYLPLVTSSVRKSHAD